MKKVSNIDELQSLLNLAYSLNYLVLSSSNRANPVRNQGIVFSDDIFRTKTIKAQIYDNLLYNSLNVREISFSRLKDYLYSFDYPTLYEYNTEAIINLYNKTTDSPLKVGDIFSEKGIKNIEQFMKMKDDVEISNASLKDKSLFLLSFQNFIPFYDEFKTWINVAEIFDALEKDITEYGQKSSSYGSPENKNLMTINKDFYENFISPVLDFLETKEKQLLKEKKKIENSSKNNSSNSEEKLFDVTAQLCSIKLIYIFDKAIYERLKSANKNPDPERKIDGLISKLYSKFVLKDTPYEINQIYIHRRELLDLAQYMSVFPELSNETELLYEIIFSDEQDISKLLVPVKKQEKAEPIENIFPDFPN